MSTRNVLLDKAAAACSPANFTALAARLHVSRQTVSQWRKGEIPLPDARIVELCAIAHEDPADWLVTIHADEGGKVGAAWARVARRLGIAASVALAALLPFVLALGASKAQARPIKCDEMRTASSLCAKRRRLRDAAALRHLGLSVIRRLHAWTNTRLAAPVAA
jgi:transcriptional regulator with XRE-family HTH domain